MSLDHDFLVGLSKSFGLFYLLALSAAVLVYAYWPSNKKRFDHAAQSILRDQDRASEDRPNGDGQWR
jgi:cytochrome c oxidase cbb3-type subunit IV